MSFFKYTRNTVILSSHLTISTVLTGGILYSSFRDSTTPISQLTLEGVSELLPVDGLKYFILINSIASITILVQLLIFRLTSDFEDANNQRRGMGRIGTGVGDLGFDALSEIHIKLALTSYNIILASNMLTDHHISHMKIMSQKVISPRTDVLAQFIVVGLILFKQCHYVLFNRSSFPFAKETLIVVDQPGAPIPENLKFSNVCTKGLLTLALYWYTDLRILFEFIKFTMSSGVGFSNVLALDHLLVCFDLLDVTIKYLLNLVELIYLKFQCYTESQEKEENEDEDAVWENKIWITKLASFIITFFKVYCVGFEIMRFMEAGKLPLYFISSAFGCFYNMGREMREIMKILREPMDLQRCLLDPTADDILQVETCSICLDELSLTEPEDRQDRKYPKKLQCGHILHFGCLKKWLKRSNKCPFCNSSIVDTKYTKKHRD